MSIHEYVLPRTRLRVELEFRRSQRNFIPARYKQVLTGPTHGRSTAPTSQAHQQTRLEQNRDIRDGTRGLQKPLHDIEEAKIQDHSLWEESDNSRRYLVRTVLGTAHDPFCSSRGHLEPRQLSLVSTCKLLFDLTHIDYLDSQYQSRFESSGSFDFRNSTRDNLCASEPNHKPLLPILGIWNVMDCHSCRGNHLSS